MIVRSLSLCTKKALGGEYKAKQNLTHKLGVFPTFQSKNSFKVQEYPSVDDSEGIRKDVVVFEQRDLLWSDLLTVNWQYSSLQLYKHACL